MKKLLALLLVLAMAFSVTACGGETSETEESSDNSTVEVDENLLSVELTVPVDFVEEGTTQEGLDSLVAEKGFKSATLNDDGSVTYVMTKGQHKELMEGIKASIDESIADMMSSGDYPTIVDIKANDNYTAFDVTLSSDALGLTESLSALVLYMCGGMYNAFNGTTVDNISVSFISQATGEVIQTANSSDMQT